MLAVAVIAVILIINILLWWLLLPRLVERKISRFQNDLVNRYYDEIEVMYRKMRGWRHDYHNHIQTLLALADDEEKTRKYLLDLNADLTCVDTVIKTGNVMVDAILNSKLSLVRSKGIYVNARAVVPSDLQISEIDLCVIIGNLLDNALEACVAQSPGHDPDNSSGQASERNVDHGKAQERFIRLFIGILKDQLYVTVSNSVSGQVRKEGKTYLSTKNSEGHGFGLMRVDRIVKKYDGYINRQDEEGVFATEIMLPLEAF